MMLKPEVVAQLERVLSSVEQLLPKACKPVDWLTCSAANWRCHSLSSFLEPVTVWSGRLVNERWKYPGLRSSSKMR